MDIRRFTCFFVCFSQQQVAAEYLYSNIYFYIFHFSYFKFVNNVYYWEKKEIKMKKINICNEIFFLVISTVLGFCLVDSFTLINIKEFVLYEKEK